jgi:small subunit ribosomal protein S8
MMTDPIADMLTRIRNAGQAGHRETVIPSSKLKLALARVLEAEGFLSAVRVEAREGHAVLIAGIRYDAFGKPLIEGLQRISRPGRRVYVNASRIPRVRNGLGIAVLSTSRGVVSDRIARETSLGGEVLCEVW